MTQYCGDFLVDDKVIRHRMQTEAGTSGAPILELVEGEYVIRGIHNADASRLGIPHRTAVLLTERMMKSIQGWLSPRVLTFDFSTTSII